MVKNRWNQIILAIFIFAMLGLSTISTVLLCDVSKRASEEAKTYQATKEKMEAEILEMKHTLTMLTYKTCTNQPLQNPSEDVEADILYDVFSLRESNGKIGVYTEAGYLIRLLDVDVATLPRADREQLSEGICVNSWRELIALIEDYEE